MKKLNLGQSSLFDLTLTQQDIYFDQLHHEQCPLYNIGGYIRFTDIKLDLLERAHQFLVSNHDAFGIRIVNQQQRLVQYISDKRNLTLEVVDFRDKSDPIAAADAWLQQLFSTLFDVHEQELFRAYVLQLSDNQYRYVGFAHHLIMDGWGFAQWAKILGQYYNQLAAEQTLSAVESAQLAWHDVASQSEQYRQSRSYANSTKYWQQQLPQFPSSFLTRQYAADFTETTSTPSGREVVKVPESLHLSLVDLATQLSISIAQLYLTLVSIYFARVHQQTKINLGIPAHNRRDHGQKQMIGVFTSVSPLCLTVEQNLTFADFCQQVSKQQKLNYRHQRFPIGELQRAFNQYHPENTNLYDIGFNYLKLDSQLLVEGHVADLVYLSHNHEQTPLMLTVWEYGEGSDIELQLDHNLAYFNAADANDIGQHLLAICQDLVRVDCDVNQVKLSDIQLLTEDEREQILTFSQGSQLPQSNLGLHQLFEQWVETQPDAIALSFAERSLSYGELNQYVNRLAQQMKANGVVSESKVGIKMNRGIEMIASVLAVLKLGAAYVALDPAYPSARLDYISQDSSVVLILTDSANASESNPVAELVVDNLTLDHLPSDNLAVPFDASQLAYLLYTSGSTGKPKGVMVSHQNVTALLAWADDYFSDDELSKVLASTSLNFDLSVFELFVPLCLGKQLVLVDGILDLLQQNVDVSLINTVPMAMKVLVEQGAIAAGVKTIVLGGEQLSTQLVNDILSQQLCHKVVNGYGPTEDTVYSTYATFERSIKGTVPIGQSIANSSAWVLSDNLELLPLGVEGELYLGGAGVTYGYYNRATLTAEQFIDNPFIAGGKLYRTGDIVRRDKSGQLTFIGRKDEQVKIRGFRVELSEVQWHLHQLESVADALVTTSQEHLVAYVINADNANNSADNIAALLQQTLPAHMVPTVYIFVEKWPLTPNGKIDKKALPTPQSAIAELDGFAQLSDETEVKLAQIWSQLLDVDIKHIGTDSNFFSLGGHSLHAVQLCGQLQQNFGCDVAMNVVFSNTTLVQQANWLKQAASDQGVQALITRVADGQAPLSFAQQRLWFIDKLEGHSQQYNIFMPFVLSAPLDITALSFALNQVVNRHQVLRTVFVTYEGQTRTQLLTDVALEVKWFDLTDLAIEQQATQAQQLALTESGYQFDLTKELMLRASYVKTDDALSDQLLLNLHHIAGDGWSLDILLAEIKTAYQAYLADDASSLTELEIQYGDFAQWQRDRLQGEVLAKQRQYWLEALAGIPLQHSLPLDFARPSASTSQIQGGVVRRRIDGTQLSALQQLAQSHQLTLFMLLHAGLSWVLSRHSNQDDIVIGTPVACRTRPELDALIGFFANTLVLRVDTQHVALADYFAHVREVNVKALEHQEFPFEQLVEHFKLSRQGDVSPLFQIMFSLNIQQSTSVMLADCQLSFQSLDQQAAKFDLDITAQRIDDGIEFSWVYDKSIFNEQHVSQLAEHLVQTLQQLSHLDCAQALLSDVEVLPPEERQHLLYELNDTESEFDAKAKIHQLFEQQVCSAPDATALIYAEQQMSYRQLNAKANQLARQLLSHQSSEQQSLTGQYIGVCVERNIDMVVCLLAVLKTGAAYVPLDPNYPKQRLGFIAADCQMSMLITQQVVLEDVIDSIELPQGVEVLVYDDPTNVSQRLELAEDNLTFDASATDATNAYVIYTSGSTGRPKGVMIQHQNAVAMLHWAGKTYESSQLAGVLASTSMCFDLSIFELFAPLSSGGCAVIVDNILALSAEYQPWFDAITLVNTVPSAASSLLAAGAIPTHLPKVTTVNLAGEPLSTELVNQLYQAGIAKVYDLYGPSEDTTYSTFTLRQPNALATIGRPIDNTQVYVVNSKLQLMPKGAVGELLIGGAGLSSGYLNRPQLTAEQFINNPFYQPDMANSPARVYKTGDLVRWHDDGQGNASLRYLGRLDHQVKIHGFRIELDEVQGALQQHSEVKECLVVAIQQDDSEPYLCGYVVAEAEASLQVDALRHDLSEQLPSYMVPKALMILAEMPLNANGKIDRQALPKPDFSNSQGGFTELQTDTERQLASIWQQLLDLERVGRDDDFFMAGGHSLLMVRMLAAIERQFGCKMQLKDVFDYPLLLDMAKHLDKLAVSDQTAKTTTGAIIPHQAAITDSTEYFDLSFAQTRLWFLAQLESSTAEQGDAGHSSYNMPAIYLLKGQLNVAKAQQALNTIIARHQVLRSCFELVKGQPKQRFNQSRDFAIQHSTIAMAGRSIDAVVEQHSSKLRQQRFDLTQGELLTVEHVELTGGDTSALLSFNLHHIIFDGWSVNLLMDEFIALYQQQTELAPLSVQYVDYVYWQQQQFDYQARQNDLAYWQQLMQGAPSAHRLPLKQPRQQNVQPGAVFEHHIDAATIALMQPLLQQHKATLFMLLQASFALHIGRLSFDDDVVLGAPIAGRDHYQLQQMIGLFLNTQLFRTNLANEPSFHQLLATTKAQHLTSSVHNRLPFEMLVDAVNPPRVLAQAPLFQIMINYNNAKGQQVALPDCTMTRVSTLANEPAKYDITLYIEDDDVGGVKLIWHYNSVLFTHGTIAMYGAEFEFLLQNLIAKPELPVRFHPWLRSEKIAQVYLPANDEPMDSCYRRIEQMALIAPHQTALRYGDLLWDRATLVTKVAQFAMYLSRQGINRHSRVAIGSSRNEMRIVAILAVLKLGACYVPVSSEFPPLRVRFMLEDSAAQLLISDSASFDEDWLGEYVVSRLLMLDDEEVIAEIAACPSQYPTAEVKFDDPAHIIYTSGSTGQPKGVVNNYGATANRLDWMLNEYPFNANDKSIHITSMAFIRGVWELLLPLVGGCELLLSDRKIVKDSEGLSDLVIEQQITRMVTAPSLMRSMCQSLMNRPQQVAKWPLTHWFVSGEPLLQSHANELLSLLPQVNLINLYGSTEVLSDVLFKSVEQDSSQHWVPVGQAIDQVDVVIVDKQGNRVPDGVMGQIRVTGAALANHYLNADKNAVNSAFTDTSTGRAYLTGDLGLKLANGDIQCFGRMDDQLKIRGHRVELGEIVAQINSCQYVKQATVVIKPVSNGVLLLAYVVAKACFTGSEETFKQDLMVQLKRALPSYMLPTAIVMIEAMPLKSNGKIDKAQLPEYDDIAQMQRQHANTATEQQLVTLWSEALLRQESVICVESDFFVQGGNSLLVTQVLQQLEQQFDFTMSYQEFFADSAIRTIAAQIDTQIAAKKVIEAAKSAPKKAVNKLVI